MLLRLEALKGDRKGQYSIRVNDRSNDGSLSSGEAVTRCGLSLRRIYSAQKTASTDPNPE
jgi:hypothetical protein